MTIYKVVLETKLPVLSIKIKQNENNIFGTIYHSNATPML